MRLAARGRHLKSLIAEVSALEALADHQTATRLLADLKPSMRLCSAQCKRKAAAVPAEDEPRAKQPPPTPTSSPSPPPYHSECLA